MGLKSKKPLKSKDLRGFLYAPLAPEDGPLAPEDGAVFLGFSALFDGFYNYTNCRRYRFRYHFDNTI